MTDPIDSNAFLKTVSSRPGVYRMLAVDGKIIYVGKARNLKKRIASYFNKRYDSAKTAALVERINDIQVTVTNTEAEALILEQSLIKEHRPRYNVDLRDDKSYPYIYLDDQHEFPRISFYRGSKSGKGKYFGPYPSAGAVRQTLVALQKLFQIRQCEDSFFKNRSRPCLQYQIKNCTAPCVGYIDKDAYAADVAHTQMFLQGKSSQIIETLVKQMEVAASDLNYEFAARLRDRIAHLQRIRERNYMRSEKGDLDIIACELDGGQSCVQVFFVRDGRNLGNRAFFPATPAGSSPSEVLSAFISRYYVERQPPAEFLISHPLEDEDLLIEAFAQQTHTRVAISHRLRGERARWMQTAKTNAHIALETRMASKAGMAARLESLQEILDLDESPKHMECFDISHTQGEGTVASCVVFNAEGPDKQRYRRFNIDDVAAGDDYAAIEQVVRRRYSRLLKEGQELPDVVFIDGGKGQLAKAETVFEELQITGVKLVSVAKGEGRRAGLESLFMNSKAKPLTFAVDSPGLHLMLQMRDEAHRFAILGHRKRRDKKRKRSALEDIPGLGVKRRQQLYKHFGGMQGVKRAGIEDLAQVPGISTHLAGLIYVRFHGEESSDRLAD